MEGESRIMRAKKVEGFQRESEDSNLAYANIDELFGHVKGIISFANRHLQLEDDDNVALYTLRPALDEKKRSENLAGSRHTDEKQGTGLEVNSADIKLNGPTQTIKDFSKQDISKWIETIEMVTLSKSGAEVAFGFAIEHDKEITESLEDTFNSLLKVGNIYLTHMEAKLTQQWFVSENLLHNMHESMFDNAMKAAVCVDPDLVTKLIGRIFQLISKRNSKIQAEWLQIISDISKMIIERFESELCVYHSVLRENTITRDKLNEVTKDLVSQCLDCLNRSDSIHNNNEWASSLLVGELSDLANKLANISELFAEKFIFGDDLLSDSQLCAIIPLPHVNASNKSVLTAEKPKKTSQAKASHSSLKSAMADMGASHGLSAPMYLPGHVAEKRKIFSSPSGPNTPKVCHVNLKNNTTNTPSGPVVPLESIQESIREFCNSKFIPFNSNGDQTDFEIFYQDVLTSCKQKYNQDGNDLGYSKSVLETNWLTVDAEIKQLIKAHAEKYKGTLLMQLEGSKITLSIIPGSNTKPHIILNTVNVDVTITHTKVKVNFPSSAKTGETTIFAGLSKKSLFLSENGSIDRTELSALFIHSCKRKAIQLLGQKQKKLMLSTIILQLSDDYLPQELDDFLAGAIHANFSSASVLKESSTIAGIAAMKFIEEYPETSFVVVVETPSGEFNTTMYDNISSAGKEKILCFFS